MPRGSGGEGAFAAQVVGLVAQRVGVKRFQTIDDCGVSRHSRARVAQVEGWILGVPGLIRAAGQREDSATPAACDRGVFTLH